MRYRAMAFVIVLVLSGLCAARTPVTPSRCA